MLPMNTSSHIQPMDAGTINNFKVHYIKRNLVKHYVRQIDEKGSFERADLKQAIYFVKDAWDTVTSDTITNCFRHVRIILTWSGSTPPVRVTLDEEHLQAGIDRMNLDSPLSAVAIDTTEDTEAPLTDDALCNWFKVMRKAMLNRKRARMIWTSMTHPG